MSLNSILLFRLSLLLIAAAFLMIAGIDSAQADREKSAAVVNSSAAENQLSYTKYGWKNIDYWMKRPKTEIRMDRIHPLVWSALILLGTLTLAFWSADEIEIQRITRSFGKSFLKQRAS